MSDSDSPITLAAFIAAHKITMRAEYADRNPNMDDMPSGSLHWKCIFRRGNKQMTIPFSQGPAIFHCVSTLAAVMWPQGAHVPPATHTAGEYVLKHDSL